MKRREFIALLGAVVAGPRAVAAQSPSKTYRIGVLSSTAPIGENHPLGAALIRVLAERGYETGKNLAFERRGAEGRLDRLPDLAAFHAASLPTTLRGTPEGTARHQPRRSRTSPSQSCVESSSES